MNEIYKYDVTTKELIQELEINETYGVNLPFTTTVKPLAKKDSFAICFNGTKWEYVEDNRNKTVYSKETKQELKVDYLGVIKDEHTLLTPKQFDEWDYETNCWACDEVEKEKARVRAINSYTQSFITKKYPLEKQSSANLGIYGDDYKNKMIKFISNCINLSNVAVEKKIIFDDYKAELDNS